MSAPTVDADAATFLEAMGAGVAVVAVIADDAVSAVAVASIASYSIDPPSVVVSVSADIADHLEPAFGVSLLTAAQVDLADDIWQQTCSDVDMVLRDGAPLVPDALAHLVCRPALVSSVAGGWVVIAEVTDATSRGAPPLVRLDGAFYGESP